MPEWGTTIYVRVLTGEDRAKIQRAIDKDNGTLSAVIVQLSAVDEDGAQLFKKDNIPRLNRKNCLALERIVKKSHDINKLDEEEIEALEKNSDATTSGNSGTG